MSFSGSKLLPGLAATAGISAFAMPLIVPWHLLTVIVATLAATFTARGKQRAFFGAVSFIAVLLVLQVQLSASLAAACFSAAALMITNRVALAVCILALNLSATAAIQELLGEFLHTANLEAAAPAVLAALMLALASMARSRSALAIGSAMFALGGVWAATRAVSAPELVMTIGAVPVMLAAALLGAAEPTPQRSAIPMGAVFIAALATWLVMPPKLSDEIWLLIPDAPETYEAKYFENYVEALRFAGLDVELASSAEEIPMEATVLMPWMTAEIRDDQRIGGLARQRRWTVVIGGEHTNMGNVATRIEAMTGRALLRRDLTVPRGNTDDSGPMRIPEISAWPHGAIFNRGASVTIASLTDKVLLAGDGWWAEPEIGEWLWVGDYVWRNGDRAGRLAMAVASDIGGARWVVLGDNSPLVNLQLIADPRATIRVMWAATLWPSAWNDLLLAVLAAVIAFGMAPSLIVFLPLAAISTVIAFDRPSQAWKDFYLGESGFDERNFNNVVAKYPALVDGRRLIRLKAPVSGRVAPPDGSATMFMLTGGAAEIGGVQLDRCHRLGSLTTSEGPYLMDAQACRISGKASVLIGTKESAAAFAVGETIVILDTAFLAQKAPLANVEWLLNEIGR